MNPFVKKKYFIKMFFFLTGPQWITFPHLILTIALTFW